MEIRAGVSTGAVPLASDSVAAALTGSAAERGFKLAAQSLQRERRRRWQQIWLPMHSLQIDRRRLCSQIWLPPQSLHRFRRRLCSQNCDPPQSLQLLRSRPCTQIWLPPQSLHRFRRRLCSHSCDPKALRDRTRARGSGEPCSGDPDEHDSESVRAAGLSSWIRLATGGASMMRARRVRLRWAASRMSWSLHAWHTLSMLPATSALVRRFKTNVPQTWQLNGCVVLGTAE